MKESEKEVICRKKSGGHRASNKNIRRSSYRQRSSAPYFAEFPLSARAWNTWRGTRHVMYSVRTRDAAVAMGANVLKPGWDPIVSNKSYGIQSTKLLNTE